MFCWVLLSLVEEAYLINYYSDWSNYDNVCSVLLVNDICFILDLVMVSILAYQLMQMSGAQPCKRSKNSQAPESN